MRIVFWGSSDYSLPSLLSLAEHHEICGIVTQPDKPFGRGMKQLHQTPMKQYALQHSIPVLQPVRMKDPELHSALQALEADLFVIVSYGRILPDAIIDMPRYKTINLHASLLPRYRGASPIQWALLNGDEETGNSIQYITAELDAGDIIYYSKVPIHNEDNFVTLSDKLARDGAAIMVKAVDAIAKGKDKRHPQDHSKATFSRIIHKDDALINFELDASRGIWNKYRAFFVWPGIKCTYHDRKNGHEHPVSFTKIQHDDTIQGAPGTILQADKKGLKIACAQGGISVLNIKPAGKKEMDYLAFINGYKPEAGQDF